MSLEEISPDYEKIIVAYIYRFFMRRNVIYRQYHKNIYVLKTETPTHL